MFNRLLLALAPIWGWHPVETGMNDARWRAVSAETSPVAISDPQEVDRFVSTRIRYAEDAVDRWSGPRETLRRGEGDCEDLAILKRAILIAGGVPRDRVLLILAYDTIQRRDHAFVLVYANGWLILNGRGAEPASSLRDYRPMLAMNDRRTWVFGQIRSEPGARVTIARR